jgi:CheY-like chemotaxis protein
MSLNSASKKSAWIVDDDPIARLLIKRALERTEEFNQFEEFSDGQDFISKLKQFNQADFQEPDLILLDINMPEKDGWDVLNYMTSEDIRFEKSLLAVLTSSINPRDRKKAFTYKYVKSYLNKPLNQEDVKGLNL